MVGLIHLQGATAWSQAAAGSHSQATSAACLRCEGTCSTSQPACQPPLRPARSGRRQRRLQAQAEAAATEYRGLGEIVAVQAVEGVRVRLDDAQQPVVEYLVHWKVSCMPCATRPVHLRS